MAMISQTDLENADVDAGTLVTLINGTGTTTNRLGATLKTYAQIMADYATIAGTSVTGWNVNSTDHTLGFNCTPYANSILPVRVERNGQANSGIDFNWVSSTQFNLQSYNKTGTSYTAFGFDGSSHIWYVSASEAGRIGTDKSFLLNTTTLGGWSTSAKFESKGSTHNAVSGYVTGAGTCFLARADNSSAYILDIYNSVPTRIGSITQTGGGTGVAFNGTSAARLKENIADAGDAGAIIDALRVRQWDWKSNGYHEAFGFVAQEEAEVYPAAVAIGDEEAEIVRPWGRDDSKLVPLLVKEIQALRQRIAALEAL